MKKPLAFYPIILLLLVSLIHTLTGCDSSLREKQKQEIEVYKQAIRINPDDADAHFYLGRVYTASHMWKEAIESFKQAIKINPDDADAHFSLGASYLILKDRGSAIEQYKILKSLDSELANELFNLINQ